MTKEQAKKFAKIYIAQMWFDFEFKRDEIDCSKFDENLIVAEINTIFSRMLGNLPYMTPSEIYNLVTQDDDLL